DQRRNFSVVRLKDSFDRCGIVVAGEQRVAGRGPGDAWTGRNAECERTRSSLDEKRIRMPVIAPFELDDLVASGRRARDPDRAHRRFGAGADESDSLKRRHQFAYAFAELNLERTGRTVARA